MQKCETPGCDSTCQIVQRVSNIKLYIQRFHSRGQQLTTLTGLVRTSNMAAVSLSMNNNMAAVKSCENILHVLFPLLLVLKLDSPTGYFNWGLPKNCTAVPDPQKKSPLLRFF